MGMIFTDNVTNDAGRFFVRPVVGVAEFVHGKENPAMYGFKTVAYIRNRPTHNDTQGVFQI